MKKRKPAKIAYRNCSPYGWWVASYIERFEWKSDDRSKPNRRCLAYENTILIKAPDRESAYKKALGASNCLHAEWRSYGDKPPGRPGRWVFEGLTSFLAIHDELENGAEIIWRIHGGRRVSTIKSLVKTKQQLEAFID